MSKLIIALSLILLASFGASQKQEILSMPLNVGVKFTCSKAYQGDAPVVKVIGDVNGDSIADFAVGVPLADFASSTASGLVAIIYGSTNLVNGLDVCTFSDTSVGFRIRGPAASKFGANIVSMGDLNADGNVDIAVSAPAYGNVGRVYVIYMPAINGRKVDNSVSSLSTYSLTSVTGSALLGTYLADPVDYNGDTFKDVLIANNANDASAYILFGNPSRSGDVNTNTMGPLVGITITQDPAVTDTGFARLPVASCADLSQDTSPDFVIMGTNNIFILYGNGSRAINENVVASNAQGEVISLGTGLTFTNTKSVTCADLDMDGRQELILSLSDGNVHVLYGSTLKGIAGSTTVNAKSFNQGFIITTISGATNFGQSLKRTDGWNGYGQDTLLIGDTTSSAVFALYASSGSFNASSGMTSYVIDNMKYPQQGFKIWTQDGTYKLGSSMDASYDVNGDGVKDLLVSEGVAYNGYAFYGQCQSFTGCACPFNLKYSNGQCVNWGLSGGQKVGIIVGVIIGAMLLIALGVLILKKTSCGANCFESYAKPAQFGSHTHAPIPQTMATSA